MAYWAFSSLVIVASSIKDGLWQGSHSKAFWKYLNASTTLESFKYKRPIKWYVEAVPKVFEIAIAISNAYLILPFFWSIFDNITKAYKLYGSLFKIEFASAKALSVVYYRSE